MLPVKVVDLFLTLARKNRIDILLASPLVINAHPEEEQDRQDQDG